MLLLYLSNGKIPNEFNSSHFPPHQPLLTLPIDTSKLLFFYPTSPPLQYKQVPTSPLPLTHTIILIHVYPSATHLLCSSSSSEKSQNKNVRERGLNKKKIIHAKYVYFLLPLSSQIQSLKTFPARSSIPFEYHFKVSLEKCPSGL